MTLFDPADRKTRRKVFHEWTEDVPVGGGVPFRTLLLAILNEAFYGIFKRKLFDLRRLYGVKPDTCAGKALYEIYQKRTR